MQNKLNKFTIYLILNCAAALTLNAKAPDTKNTSGEIHEVATKKELTNIQDKAKKTVLKIHATWCGACKMCKPQYDKLAKKHGDKAIFAETDTDHPKNELNAEHNVTALPTFVVLDENGNVIEKIIGYDVEKIEAALAQNTKTNLIEEIIDLKEEISEIKEEINEIKENFIDITSENNFKDLIKKHKKVVTMFHSPNCGHCKNIKPIIPEYANSNSEIMYLLVDVTNTNNSGLGEYSKQGVPTFIFFNNGSQVDTLVGADQKGLYSKTTAFKKS